MTQPFKGCYLIYNLLCILIVKAHFLCAVLISNKEDKMNKAIFGLIFLLVVLNLLGFGTGTITTFIVACLLLLGAATWVWHKQFPKSVFKNIILIMFLPLVLISVGSIFMQTISILNPADALLVLIIVTALFWLLPKLLK